MLRRPCTLVACLLYKRAAIVTCLSLYLGSRRDSFIRWYYIIWVCWVLGLWVLPSPNVFIVGLLGLWRWLCVVGCMKWLWVLQLLMVVWLWQWFFFFFPAACVVTVVIVAGRGNGWLWLWWFFFFFFNGCLYYLMGYLYYFNELYVKIEDLM